MKRCEGIEAVQQVPCANFFSAPLLLMRCGEQWVGLLQVRDCILLNTAVTIQHLVMTLLLCTVPLQVHLPPCAENQ